MKAKKYVSIDEYLGDFPSDVGEILNKIKEIIASEAPDAVPCIAYNMPAFKLFKKPLVYFAGYQYHIGFYALPSGNLAFQEELSGYKVGKGSIQFPLDQPMPYDLIKQIVQFRVMEVSNDLKKVTDGKK